MSLYHCFAYIRILHQLCDQPGLQALGNIDPKLHQKPEELLRYRNAIFKKSCLCLLRMYRSNPDCVDPAQWAAVFPSLLESDNLGVLTSAMSLLLSFTSHNHHLFEDLVPHVLYLFQRVLFRVGAGVAMDYTYYRIPSPWLQIKLLRFLQYFSPPEGEYWRIMSDVLYKILTKVDITEDGGVNKGNAEYAISFEAIALVVSWGAADPANSQHVEIHTLTHQLLGKYIAESDPNVRYLSMDMLVRVVKVDGISDVQRYQDIIIGALNDNDMSVRKRALEVVYLITDKTNAESVVSELVLALETAESDMRDEMVMKIAILAERFYTSTQWYLGECPPARHIVL